MGTISLTRIDNRLLHGQVTAQWSKSLGASFIIVANDDLSLNINRQKIMNMAMPSDITGKYWALDYTVSMMPKFSPSHRIIIICETPQDVLKLVRSGVDIKKVNVGNMHMAEGKRKVSTSVSVDDRDVATFKELRDLGVELEIKMVPNSDIENAEKLFE